MFKKNASQAGPLVFLLCTLKLLQSILLYLVLLHSYVYLSIYIYIDIPKSYFTLGLGFLLCMYAVSK